MVNTLSMKTISHKMSVTFGLLLCFLLPLNAQAAGDSVFLLEDIESADGFATSQPTITSLKLQRAIEDTDHYLQHQQVTLEKNVKKHRDAGNNILLAAVMPGGLLYMAYHKAQQSVAENDLAFVKQSQVELQEDWARLELDKQPVIIARFP